MGSTDLVLSAVRFHFRGAKLTRFVVLRRTEGIGFYRFYFVGSPLPVSRGETSERCRTAADWGIEGFSVKLYSVLCASVIFQARQ